MQFWIDIDDTLCDTDSVFMTRAIQFHSQVLKRKMPNAIRELNFSPDYFYFARYLDWNEEDIRLFFHSVYPDILRQVLPKKGACKWLEEQRRLCNDIVLISARHDKEFNGETLKITKQWLDKYNIIVDGIILDCIDKPSFLMDKHGVYIDDSYSDCMAVVSNPNIHVVQFVSKYGKQCESTNVTKMKNWDDLAKIQRNW